MTAKSDTLYYVASNDNQRDGFFGKRWACTRWYFDMREIELVLSRREGSTWNVLATSAYVSFVDLVHDYQSDDIYPYSFVVEAATPRDAHTAARRTIAARILFGDVKEHSLHDRHFRAGRAECALFMFLPFGALRSLYFADGGNFGDQEEWELDDDVELWSKGEISPAILRLAYDMFVNQSENLDRLGPAELQLLASQVANRQYPVDMHY